VFEDDCIFCEKTTTKDLSVVRVPPQDCLPAIEVDWVGMGMAWAWHGHINIPATTTCGFEGCTWKYLYSMYSQVVKHEK